MPSRPGLTGFMSDEGRARMSRSWKARVRYCVACGRGQIPKRIGASREEVAVLRRTFRCRWCGAENEAPWLSEKPVIEKSTDYLDLSEETLDHLERWAKARVKIADTVFHRLVVKLIGEYRELRKKTEKE